MSRICKNCRFIGEETHPDWEMYQEHWHECEFAADSVGLVEEEDPACPRYESKENG